MFIKHLLFYLFSRVFINVKPVVLNPGYTLESPGSGAFKKNTGTWHHPTPIKSESLGGKPDP